MRGAGRPVHRCRAQALVAVRPGRTFWSRRGRGRAGRPDEEILTGESGEAAAARALALVDLRTRLGDERGARRALELDGSAPRAAGRCSSAVRHLRAQRSLGGAVRSDGRGPRSGATDRPGAVALWAARRRLRRERLEDPAGAAEILRHAAAISPGDDELMRELAAILLEINRWIWRSRRCRARCVAADLAPAARLGLLACAPSWRATNGEDGLAVADLEQAFALGGNDVAIELGDALARYAKSRRTRGADRGGAGSDACAWPRC